MYQGYKERCLFEDNAIAMWSFDGDQFERATNLPLMEFILDEVDNQNSATIIHEYPTKPCLTIGHPSLIELEQTNQYSAIFGRSVPDSQHPWGAYKTYLSVPHSPAFNFPDRGSFSVEFIFKKDEEYDWSNFIRSHVYKVAPIIRKPGVFSISIETISSRNFLASGPLGTFSINSNTYKLFSRFTHVVFTWGVKQIDGVEYEGTQRLFINGRIAAENKQRFFDTFPNTNTTSPIEIGGTSETPNNPPFDLNDRNVSRLYIDQISIYGYALDEFKVMEHYKKIFSYDKMIEQDDPEHYWPLDDQETVLNKTIKPRVGSIIGKIYGGIERHVEGPDKLIGYSAVQSHYNGHIHFERDYYYSKVFEINRDYTFDFWFLSSAYEPGPLLALIGYSSNFDGLLVEINKADNRHSPGALQFTERKGVYCFHNGFYNDGNWHHFLVRRKETKIEMFVDGILKAEIPNVSYSSLSEPGDMFLFGCSSNYFATQSKMSNLAMYPYALSDWQIKARANYLYKFIIRGIITLQGNPFPGTLRLYYSNTGEFIKEITANEFTGEYKVELPDNRAIDILVFDKYNKNVRFRAYGPVTPSPYQEFPIQL